jgi:hypothetical protein
MPIDRGIVDQQLQALGDSARWWDQRELRDLPAVLNADEQILAISRGKIARVRWLRRSWLIVVTDRRLLCIRSGGPTTWRQVEVDADDITRVVLRVGPMRGRVVVIAGGQSYRLLVPRPDSFKLSAALTSLGANRRESPSASRPALMVRRVVDHVLALPAAALNPTPASPPVIVRPDTSRMERRLESMEEQVRELQDQVQFLEQLLRRRHEGNAPLQSRPTSDVAAESEQS